MRRIFSILLFLFMLQLTALDKASPLKLAIVGEPNLCDRITAELSKNQDFELLERAEIDKILNEHKWNAALPSANSLIHRIPHADLCIVITVSRIRVFNAKNGYTLANCALPDGASLEKILAIITDSVRKREARDTRLLSIGSVRLLGGTSKERSAALVYELAEKLVRSPEIQVLERDHLGAILEERELSGLLRSLTPAAIIINLEFHTGASPDILNAEMVVTNSSGKTLFNETIAGLADADALYKSICCWLKTSPTDLRSDLKSEAAGYHREYKEYLRLSGNVANFLPPGYMDAASWLDAMLALDPDNPKYQYEKIFYELCKVHDNNDGAAKIKILKNYIRQANAFIDRFPDFKYPLYSGGFHHVGGHPVQPLSNWEDHRFQGAEKEALAALIPQIKEIDRRNRDGNSEWFLEDPASIQTVKDLEKFRATRRARLDLTPEIDAARMVEDRFRADADIIRTTREFIRKHPEQASAAIKNFYYPFFPFHNELPEFRRKEAWEKIRRLLDEHWEQIEQLYGGAGTKDFVDRLNLLTALREYLNSDGSFRAFTKAFDGALERSNPRSISPNMYYFHELSKAASYRGLKWQDLSQYSLSRPSSFMLERKGKTDAVYLLSSGKSYRELLAHEESIRALGLLSIQKNEVGNALGRLAFGLYYTKNQNADAWQLLHSLNGAFDIREVEVPWEACLAAASDENRIYLLCVDKNNQNLRLFRYDADSEKLEPLVIPELKFHEFQSEQAAFGQLNSSSLSVTGNKVIAGGRNQMLLYDVSSGRTAHLKNLPGGLIASASIVGDRIYYLCGGRQYPALPGLYSCTLEGQNSRIHFSGGRLSRRHELDKLASAKVSELIRLPDSRLLFSLNFFSDYGKMWVFDPKDETFESIGDPKTEHIVNLRQQGDFILGQGGRSFGEAWFTLDPDTLRREWFFTQRKDAKDHDYKYRINGYYSMQSPALFLENRYLVSGGRYGSKVLDLPNPEKSPLLLLPEATDLFYLPGRKEMILPVMRIHPMIMIVSFKEGENR